MDRMAIYQAMGWFAPALISVAQGERSMCNYDEDSLTMAVAAAQDCLIGKDKKKIDAGYLCSTTLPFSDRQNAGILATALNLRSDINTATSRPPSGPGPRSPDGPRRRESGQPQVHPGRRFGQAPHQAGRLLRNVVRRRRGRPDGRQRGRRAEFKGSYSVTYDFVDHFRGSWSEFDYTWEERWLREEGYSKFIPRQSMDS